jgi:hypothetical protein
VKVVSCNDPMCAGGDETFSQPDQEYESSWPRRLSMTLDPAGNPVLAYVVVDGRKQLLRLLVCDDPACAGGGEIATTIASGPFGRGEPAVGVNHLGHPVIAISRAIRRARCRRRTGQPRGDCLQRSHVHRR